MTYPREIQEGCSGIRFSVKAVAMNEVREGLPGRLGLQSGFATSYLR